MSKQRRSPSSHPWYVEYVIKISKSGYDHSQLTLYPNQAERLRSMGFCVTLVSKNITEDAISKKNKYCYIISWKKVTEPGVAFRCMENTSKYWNSENGKQILQKRRTERKAKRIQRQNGQPNEESFCEEPPDVLCTFDAQGGFCQGEICNC